MATLFLSSSHGRCAEQRFDWMPLEASSGKLSADDLGGEMIVPEITVTSTPKSTADISRFTRVFEIPLDRFGISNDGTHPVETSRGINEALQEARKAGANRIVFPQGTYSISGTAPIVLDHQDTIIDLNGATLQINANGLPRYAVVEIIDGAENLRLTNGTLKGDKEVHDYKTQPGTHEWGCGIRFVGGRNLEIDHVVSRDMTGDGVSSSTPGTRTRPELLARIMHTIYARDLESGALDEHGAKVPDSGKTRSIKPFDLTKCEGQFEFGYLAGYMGFPFIKGRVYTACFYDAEMAFLARQKCLQYRKIAIPPQARWMHLEFNQPEVTDEPAHAGAAKGGWVARITNFRPSVDVHFHHNVMTENRRLGMAFCGGQRWLIEENSFTGNGGTNPAYGVDLEDGSELMQDVVFRHNKFHGNRGGDLVVCAGTELIFEDNEFEKSVVTWGRPHNYIFRNNRHTGGHVTYSTRTGFASIHDNRYENCQLAITFDTKAVADGLVRKPGQTVRTPTLKLERETLRNVTSITGTYFDFSDCVIDSSHFIAGSETQLIRLTGGQITNSSILYEANGPPVKVHAAGVEETGPGLDRRRPVQ